MKLGFLRACMPERSLEEIAAWAGANGYEALELAAWPRLGDRPFTASHVAADAFDDAEADRVRSGLDANGLELSALAYYDNPSARSSAAPPVSAPRTPGAWPRASSRRSWTTRASAAFA